MCLLIRIFGSIYPRGVVLNIRTWDEPVILAEKVNVGVILKGGGYFNNYRYRYTWLF